MAAGVTLYDLDVSGNCYKVRLFLALIGRPYERVAMDFMGGEHRSPAMLERNPFGELPVLVDGDLVLRDSQAILIYLARQYGGDAWFPTEPAAMARVAEWLMTAENEIARGPNDARLHDKFGYKLDVALARERAGRILGLMDAYLAKHAWLALDKPTIADIACFPYIALGHEGGVPAEPYPAVRAWMDRVKALPNFVGMPGL